MGKGRTTTGMILACLLKDVFYGDKDKKYYKDNTIKEQDFSDEDEYFEEVRANKCKNNRSQNILPFNSSSFLFFCSSEPVWASSRCARTFSNTFPRPARPKPTSTTSSTSAGFPHVVYIVQLNCLLCCSSSGAFCPHPIQPDCYLWIPMQR